MFSSTNLRADSDLQPWSRLQTRPNPRLPTIRADSTAPKSTRTRASQLTFVCFKLARLTSEHSQRQRRDIHALANRRSGRLRTH